MNVKIKCESCGKVIAEGVLPARVNIKCPNCKARNDLNKPDQRTPYATRLSKGLEKK
jgi:phage FluMu protein Com